MQFDGSTLFGATLVAFGLFGLRRALRMRGVALRVARTKVFAPSRAGAGFARVRGAASSDNPVTSPFSRSECCCYHVSVEASADDGTSNGSGWTQIHEELSNKEFFIRDADCSLRVRPGGLEFDAPFAFEHEVLSKPRTDLETRLLDHVAKHVLDRLNLRLLQTLKRGLISPQRAADPHIASWLSTLESKRRLRERKRGKAYRFRERLHRVRQWFVAQRTALVNPIRGLLREFGVIYPKGIAADNKIPELLDDAKNGIPDRARQIFWRLYEYFLELNAQIKSVDSQIKAWHRESPASQCLSEFQASPPSSLLR